MDTTGRARTLQEQHGVQMLRGLAATLVVVHHVLEVSNGASTRFSPDWLTTFGAAGVDIFFVISGFIMVYTSFRPGRPPATPGSSCFGELCASIPSTGYAARR